MKKKSVVLLMVFLMVFAASGNAFATPRWGRHDNPNQWGQTQYQYQINPYTQQNNQHDDDQPNYYEMNQDQTNPVSAQTVQQFFFDMPQNHWAYKMVKEMKKLGVINGDSDGNFYPERQVTRAEFATMIVRALHLQIDQGVTQTFTDVPSNFWGFNYIEAAKNYLTGYQNSTGQLYFDPQGSAVREDIIVAVVRAKGLGNEQPDLSVLSNYVDANNISPNLKGYVAIAVKHDLVKGSTDQTGQYHLYPQGKLTRAEAATFLYRIIQDNKVVVGQQQDSKVIVGQQPGSQTQQVPVLVTAAVNGATLTLTYNENLDTNSVPYVGDFSVAVNGIAQAAPTGITVSGNSVTITLYQSIPTGSTITLNYTPGTHPIRDLSGYNASALVNYQVSNGTSDTTLPVWPQGSALSISNLSGTGLTLTWTQATDNVGVTAYRIYQNGNLLTTVAGSVFSYNVAGLLPNTNYTFRVDAGDAAGNWTSGPSLNTTTNQQGTQQGPQLVTATVNGATLTLTYNENLDTSSVPYVGDLTIRVNGTIQSAPTGITVSGSSITMALYQPVPPGSTVTISYTPGTHPIRDLAGYTTSALVNYQVNNVTSDTTPPGWPQGSVLSVSNLSATGLTLTWPQATDNLGVTAYRIYQDGNLLTTVAGSVFSYNVSGLLTKTTHTFRVDAGDAAGNWTSGPSLNITTS